MEVDLSPRTALILIVVGSVCMAVGVALTTWWLLEREGVVGGGSDDPELSATNWTSLKLDPNYKTNEDSEVNSAWQQRLSALPHKIDSFPIHTLQPLSNLPDKFYYKACQLVPVQNQLSCNTCTIFACWSMLANRLALESGGSPKMLSVQQFLDCTGHPCAKTQALTKPLEFASNEGVVQAQYYPYEAKTGAKCLTTTAPEFNTRVFSSPVQGVSPNKPFKVGDAAHLDTIKRAQTEIFSFGPIVTVMKVYDDLLNKYRATAYDKSGKTYTGAIYSPVRGAKFVGYHAIMVVGWIKPDKNSFKEACWTCVSSWGPSWPPSPWPNWNGLFFIKMGENTCGVESQMVTAHPVEVKLK
jgi:hypothetical protein